MKILSNFLSNISNVNKVNKTENKTNTEKTNTNSNVKKDEVILSKEAEKFKTQNKAEVDYYKARLMNMKETENEKLAEIKQKYQSGQYSADMSKVVDSFIEANPEILNIVK